MLGATAAGAPLADVGPPSVGLFVSWDQPPAEAFLKQLRREVGRIFRPTGLRLVWELGSGKKPGVYHRVIVVRLQGRCGSDRVGDFRDDDLPKDARLGWTFVVDGDVIPHSVVDCDQVARTVAAMRSRFSSNILLHAMFARAAGRVLTHEMMHVLLQTPEHDGAAFTRPSLRLDDLFTAPSLRPAQVLALQRIGRPAPGVSVAQGSGR
jgi:hypothetical protein